MNDSSFFKNNKKQLWTNNLTLIKLMGITPVLAITTTLCSALALGLATLLILISSNVLISVLRKNLTEKTQIPFTILVVATLVSITDLLMQAFAYELSSSIGIFVPLIATNGIVWDRVREIAYHKTVAHAAYDGLVCGTAFLIVLSVVGVSRELLGAGTIFKNMHLIFGPAAKNWVVHPFSENFEVLIFNFPCGAFFILAALLAVKNTIDLYSHEHTK
ncbi:MAG: hypothetical protein CBC09_02755 [Cellvibrionales bacterium TMED49]|nr:electron transport complex subunit RsxE [Porticoccaceae bacterium]OUU39313.1 MAG: hypothetical protein CBC09_02755 [Cellvibrionales bacterium TMED49]